MYRKFVKSPISLSVSAAVLALAASVNIADAAEATQLEEITVTGIRASLDRSLDIKRSATGVIDSISSEDIGKLPDENVAESLQRLPGIAITRERGEGKFISVRGLGPQFSPATLNGREIASGRTDTPAVTSLSAGSGRSFAFNVLPSELIGGLDVHKTLSADVVEGGIGGLVDVKTRRPLDIPGFSAAGSLQAAYEEQSGDTNPKASFLVSNTFNDDTIGVLVSGSYTERALREDQFWSWGWYGNGVDDLSTPDVDYEDGFFPWEDATTYVKSESERIGLSGSFQFKPSDEFEMVVDALYTNFDSVNTENRAATRWTVDNNSPFAGYGVTVDPNSQGLTSVSSRDPNGVGADTPFEIVTTNEIHDLETETTALGANLEWTSDKSSLALDLSYSKAESASLNRNVRFAGNFDLEYTRDPGSDLPEYTILDDLSDTSAFRFLDTSFENDPVSDEAISVRLDYDYALDSFLTFETGLRYSTREKDQRNSRCNGCNAVLDPLGLTLSDVPLAQLQSGGFFAGEGSLVRDFPLADTLAVIDQFSLGAVAYDDRISSIYNIEEKTLAGYVKGNFSFDQGAIPISGNVGLRVVSTDSEATGSLPTLLEIANNRLIRSEGTFSTVENSYTEVLPSASIKFDVTEDLVVRASMSKSLTRPELVRMSPRFDFNLANPPTANAGNPLLQPFTGVNTDVSVEWYFAQSSLLSLALFHKDIDGFVLNETTENDVVAGQLFAAVTRPENGGSAEISGFELNWQQTFDSLPAPFDGLGVMLNTTQISTSTDFGAQARGADGFEGLSDETYNAVVFYEKGPWAARLAYNQRSEFLERNTFIFSSRSVDSYAVVDASVSYEISDNWTIVLEGVGLNEPRLGRFDAGRTDLPSVIIDTGRRFFFGVRGSF